MSATNSTQSPVEYETEYGVLTASHGRIYAQAPHNCLDRDCAERDVAYLVEHGSTQGPFTIIARAVSRWWVDA